MKKILIAALSLVTLAACAPSQVVQTPQFEMLEAGLLKLNPPGLNGGAAEAVIRIQVQGRNPNPFGLKLDEIRFDLLLEGSKIAAGIAPGFELKASGVPSQFPVDVEVPLDLNTLKNLSRIVTGQPTSYQMLGSFRVDAGILGKPNFGPYTLAQGTFKSPSLSSTPPSFAFRPDLTRLTVGLGGAALDLGFEVKNTSPVGFKLVAPLGLVVGGQTVAKAEAGGTVRARETGVISTRFAIDPLAAARILVGGKFDFQISGAPTLEVPGIQSFAFPVSALFGGTAQR
jgi:LEA14-like dessication related protein